MEYKILVGIVLALLVGVGIGYAFSETTHTSVKVVRPSPSYQMNLYQVDGFPVCVYYFPQNLPNLTEGSWTLFDNSQNRVPYVQGDLNTSWVYQQIMPAFSFNNITGWLKLIKTFTPEFREGYVQMMGDAVPPSYANGIVYVSASDGVLYAINALTGKSVFVAMLPDTLMSQPLIYHGLVYVGLGGAFFTYGQGLLNAFGGGHRGEFTGLSGLMALNASTGKPVWFFQTKSQVMPTPVILNDTIYFDDGDGYIYAVNAETGSLIWRTGPFGTANMASLDYVNASNGTILVAGFSSAYPQNVSSLVGIYTSGKIAWVTKLPFTYDSGPGDAVMAVSGDYVVDGFISGYPLHHGPLFNETLAREIVITLNETNGQIIWIRNVSGYVLPTGANNGESPAVVNGHIYINDRKDGKILALNLSNGAVIWEDPLVRGAPGLIGPTYVDGYILNPDFEYIQVINASTGKVVNLYPTGQDLVIDTPLVVGNTIIVDGGFGYVEAIPLYYVIHNTTSILKIYEDDLSVALPSS
ncbi:Outer membrane protein assembly factor BamB [Metallosphaera sp. J1]|uniref:outer membrane protein assembly factor BamB family protein n=1 Tax=Metallosphaera javensis (ex Hofmann et al. 2022) TaxID=99938 RepID=UPI001EDD9840|nr:PQQ-binding-like beta-propeller repeat protein [Metallosphaera javensis (ex Hofmann et al. 2022)]MCG3109679.1 Outer membrane protein assembly factor BamB [Metallosphaera javensis (ex Hofmann et al. 2022)]